MKEYFITVTCKKIDKTQKLVNITIHASSNFTVMHMGTGTLRRLSDTRCQSPMCSVKGNRSTKLKIIQQWTGFFELNLTS